MSDNNKVNKRSEIPFKDNSKKNEPFKSPQTGKDLNKSKGEVQDKNQKDW